MGTRVIDKVGCIKHEHTNHRQYLQGLQTGSQHKNGNVKQTQQQQGAGCGDSHIVVRCCNKNGEEHGTDAGVSHNCRRAFLGYLPGESAEKNGYRQAQKKHTGQRPGTGAIVLPVHRLWIKQVTKVIMLPVKSGRIGVVYGAAGVKEGGKYQKKQGETKAEQDGMSILHIGCFRQTYAISLRLLIDFMQKLLFIGLTALSCLFSCKSESTTFYLSPDGNDAQDGKSPATAWGTLEGRQSTPL